MAKKPYPETAPVVNPESLQPPEPQSEDGRRERLAELGLIRTEDLLEDLRMGKKNLATLRKYGATQLGVGKQKFYEISAVVHALRVEAMVRRACDPENLEADDGETQAGER